MTSKTSLVKIAAVATASAFGVAALGGAATRIGPWYFRLKKPAWTPPPPAFPIIWTVILAFTAGSLTLAYARAEPGSERRRVVGAFAANGLLNALWSPLFFTLRLPGLALIEAGGLWISILVLIAVTLPLSLVAALLLVPYLVWVGIAFVLNGEIVRLNGGMPG